MPILRAAIVLLLLARVSSLLAAEPLKDADAYQRRAREHAASGDTAAAIADYDRALALDPKRAEVYDERGSEHFKAGHVAESIADFDRAIQLRPALEPGHWKRGISYYYAGRYDDLKTWLAPAEINRDRNLRLQYLAGLQLDATSGAATYGEMLSKRRFPEDMFLASPATLQRLRQTLAQRSGSNP